MADCGKLEAAWSALKSPVSIDQLNSVVHILDEVNGGSHILNSNMLKQAPETAKSLEAQGKYLGNLDTGIAGASAVVQQQYGKANTIELTEGNRTETLRIDEKGNPVMDTVIMSCSNHLYRSSTLLNDGKATHKFVELPDGIDLSIGADGKIDKAKQDP